MIGTKNLLANVGLFALFAAAIFLIKAIDDWTRFLH
jgi:hypothetical protein